MIAVVAVARAMAEAAGAVMVVEVAATMVAVVEVAAAIVAAAVKFINKLLVRLLMIYSSG